MSIPITFDEIRVGDSIRCSFWEPLVNPGAAVINVEFAKVVSILTSDQLLAPVDASANHVNQSLYFVEADQPYANDFLSYQYLRLEVQPEIGEEEEGPIIIEVG